MVVVVHTAGAATPMFSVLFGMEEEGVLTGLATVANPRVFSTFGLLDEPTVTASLGFRNLGGR